MICVGVHDLCMRVNDLGFVYVSTSCFVSVICVSYGLRVCMPWFVCVHVFFLCQYLTSVSKVQKLRFCVNFDELCVKCPGFCMCVHDLLLCICIVPVRSTVSLRVSCSLYHVC